MSVLEVWSWKPTIPKLRYGWWVTWKPTVPKLWYDHVQFATTSFMTMLSICNFGGNPYCEGDWSTRRNPKTDLSCGSKQSFDGT